jgi:peptidoglycan LD-endopeptidase LytH
MNARTAAAFAIGFAAGMLTLGAGLKATGQIGVHSHVVPEMLPGASLPDLSAGSAPVLHPAPLPELIPPPVSQASGTAVLPRLAMPLDGIDPQSIYDSFADPRSDHRHEALDIMAPRGTPIKAVAEGNVVKLFQSNKGGLTVYQFDNSRTYCFYYAHLDRYAKGLKEGMLLRRGDVLGYVGSTGDASAEAPHLHLAVLELGPEKQWWKGTAINPLPLLRSSGAR